MESAHLVAVLQATMSPDAGHRQAAEAELSKYEVVPGQAVTLLRAAVEDGLDATVRLAASINFKNVVKRCWEPRKKDKPTLSDQDKAGIRDNIVESIIRAPKQMQVQMGEVLQMIVYADYPEHCPQLMPQVMAALTSQDHARMYGGLYALRILTRKYEFKDAEDRKPLNDIINAAFPTLLGIMQTLVADTSGSPDCAIFMKVILKSFWSSTYLVVPDILVQPDQFAGWMGCLHTCIVAPVPYDAMPADVDDRKKWPWFKMKKWAINVCYRMLMRYGEPNACNPGTEMTFATMFTEQCQMKFIEANMLLLNLLTQGKYLTPRIVNLALQCVNNAINLNKTYAHVREHCHALFTHIVFPLLCHGDEDEELWTEDPHEYIRKGYDIVEDMYSAKTAAMNLLHDLCKKRGKENLGFVMGALNAHLGEAAAAVAAGTFEAGMARKMDGTLLAIGTLRDILGRKKAYKKHLEAMLMTHVLPLFEAPFGHLRAKACWVAGVYADIDWAAGEGEGPHFQGLMGKVVERLRDPDLPVRVDAVVALRSFVDALHRVEILQPILPSLLEQFFGLMNEVENEDLVFTLETIVEKMGDQIGPYAEQLSASLCQAFEKCIATSEDDDEDDEDIGALAAYGCLRALNTLLDAVSENKELMVRLEGILFPIMDRMLSTEGQDVIEEILEMLSYFTYFCPEISPRLWGLWPKLHAAAMEWALDYMENMIMPLDNYIAKGTEVFLTTKAPMDLRESVFLMAEKLLMGDFHESDALPAPKLLECVLQNCRGRVDDYLQRYIELVVKRLQTAESRALKDHLVVCIANCLYYNAAATLHIMEASGSLALVMPGWFTMLYTERKSGALKHFRRLHDKKMCVLGLASIFTVPDEQLPQSLRDGLGQLLAAVMKLLVALKKQEEEAEAAGEDSDEEDEEEEGDDALEDDEDDDDGEDADEDAYIAKLKKAALKMVGMGGDGDSESDDDFTDDEGVAMPVDPVDPYVFFADALNYVQAHIPARMGALTSGVDANAQAALQGMMGYAEQQRQAQAAQRGQ